VVALAAVGNRALGWSPAGASLGVRAAAGSADDLQGFLGNLERNGTMVRLRYSQQDPEQVTGYAVALPGRGDDAGGPVCFGGGKLDGPAGLPPGVVGGRDGPDAD